MRKLIPFLGICLVPFVFACDFQDISGALGYKAVEFSGTVTTAQGVPVPGVRVWFTGMGSTVRTDSEGYYSTGRKTVRESSCRDINLIFYKDPHQRKVFVGKCGEREVDMSDWPVEG